MRYSTRQKMFSLFFHARQRDRGMLGTDESHQPHSEEILKKKVRHTQTLKPQTESHLFGVWRSILPLRMVSAGELCAILHSHCPLTPSLAPRQGCCFQHSPFFSLCTILPRLISHDSTRHFSTTKQICWRWRQFKWKRKVGRSWIQLVTAHLH